MSKINKLLALLIFTLFSTGILLLPVNAQAATGTLSFNPTSLVFNEGETKTVSIVYTGTEITAAEIHIKVGPGLQITDFKEGTGLIFIIDNPSAGEVHVGKLSEGNITSGSTLLTMDVKATSCAPSGTISYNTSEVLVPDVTMSFNSATYTMNCGGGNTPTATPRSGSTPPTLPKTAIVSDSVDRVILSIFTVFFGISLVYFFKFIKRDKAEQYSLVSIDDSIGI